MIDIVEQLRGEALWRDEAGKLCREAADEIERLRSAARVSAGARINDVINGLHEVARARLEVEHPSAHFVELLVEYLQQRWGLV